MARRLVQVGSTAYTIADGDPPRLELLPWAVLRTRVYDELTLAPPVVPISLTSSLPGAKATVADSGVCGLVAWPFDVSAAMTDPTRSQPVSPPRGSLGEILHRRSRQHAEP